MRPDVAARLLGEVELKWVHGKLGALLGDADEATEKRKMLVSCKKVSAAVIQGAAGDPTKVSEYMQSVCRKSKEVGYDSQLCFAFASGFELSLSNDVEYNRDSLRVDGFCGALFEGAVSDAAKKWQKMVDQPPEASTAANATTAAAANATTLIASSADVVLTTPTPSSSNASSDASTTAVLPSALDGTGSVNALVSNVSQSSNSSSAVTSNASNATWNVVADQKAKLRSGRSGIFQKLGMKE